MSWIHLALPSVCGQNRAPLCIIHNTCRIHFIFTDLINQLQKVCPVLSFVTNSKILFFGNFFKFSPFTLSCVHVMWMSIPHPGFYCSNFKFSMMRPLGYLLNIYSGFGPNCNFVFLPFFFSIVPFHLVFVVASKIKLIPLYCSHFEWPEILHAGVSWPLWELIRFWSSSVDFPHFGGILT